MRKLTKVVSALLSVTMIFSIMTVAPFTVSATKTDESTTYESNVEFVTEKPKETTEPVTEVEELTEASALISEAIQETTEPEPSTTRVQKKEVIPVGASVISSSNDYFTYKEAYIKNYCTYDYLVKEMRLPYRSFVETLDKDTAFHAELSAWKVATLDPDSLVTEITQSQQCKYYEAILIDLLVRDTQEKSFIENVQSFKDSIHVSAWKKYINYNSKILDNTPITSENTDAILKEMKSMGNFGKALKYADKIGDYIDYTVDIYDLFDKLSKVEMIVQMSESYAQVLNNMSSKCGSNVYLKTAIDNIAQVFSDDITIKQIQYIFASKSAADVVYKEFMKEVKKQVISYLGMAGMAIDLAQSAGTTVANSWFGTEDMINDYYEMSSLYEIEDLLRTAVLNTNSNTFCAAFKMYENICLMGCDYSKKYVKPLYTSLFGKLFAWATNQNYESYSAQLDDLKEQISFMFEMIEVGADSWYVIDTGNRENMNVVNGNYKITQYTEDDYLNQNEDIKLDVYSTYGSNNGNDVTLNSDLIIYNNFEVTGGMIDLNGYTLTINGNLLQPSGQMYINGGTLEVNGDYRIQSYKKNSVTDEMEYGSSSGYLVMEKSKDIVEITGDFIMQSNAEDRRSGTIGYYYVSMNVFKHGTMKIGGDFKQITGTNGTYGDSPINFTCSEYHTVILNGTKTQHIYFDSTSSNFNKLEVSNNDLVWSGKMNITTLCSDMTVDSNDLSIYKIDLNGNKAVINNDVSIDAYSLYPAAIDLNKGYLVINGNLLQPSGQMYIDGGTLEVNGNYRIQSYEKNSVTDEMEYSNSSGYLNMSKANDLVKINGSFYTQSICGETDRIYSTQPRNSLTAGTMEISGDFKQITGVDAGNYNAKTSNNFVCKDTHTVILNGNNIQTIHFDNTNSYFNNLKLTKDKEKGYTFDPDNCWKKLYLNTDVESVVIMYIKNTLKQGEAMQLVSNVNGINLPSQKVIWKISGNTDSKTAISDKGILSVSLNEKAKQITVTATSVADNTKSASVSIAIEEIVPVVNGIAITPSVVSAVCGQSCKFNAVVFGFYNPSQAVIWSISGNKSSNTKIDSNGLLTIANNETSKQITVKAVSSADKTITASVNVDVIQIKITSTIDNVTVTMETGETQHLKAVVTGTNNPSQKVIWSIIGNNSENTVINDNGEITIGKDETSSLIIVKAVSAEDYSKYGEFAINIKQNILIGDVNGDGKISILDATEIQKYIAQLSYLNDEQLAVADVNGDGKISIIDATEIQKYIAQLIPSLG